MNKRAKWLLLNLPFLDLYINDDLIGAVSSPDNMLEVIKKKDLDGTRYFDIIDIKQGSIDKINEYIHRGCIVFLYLKNKGQNVLESAGVIKALNDNIMVYEEEKMMLDSLINKLKLELREW